MKRVCRYETDDGQTFDTKEEAKSHEVVVETQVALIRLVQPAYNADRAAAVITSVVDNAREVRDLLTRHLSRQPKKAIEPFPENV